MTTTVTTTTSTVRDHAWAWAELTNRLPTHEPVIVEFFRLLFKPMSEHMLTTAARTGMVVWQRRGSVLC